MKIARLTQILTAISIIAILAIPLAIQTSNPTPVSALKNQLSKLQLRMLGGLASFELLSDANSEVNANKDPISYFPKNGDGCVTTISGNTKVNQNCLNISDGSFQGRGQAENEPAIAQDPFQPNHVIASYNDYRRGDGTCGVSYSLDGGNNWADSTVPNGFTRGAFFGASRQYWQAGGDTSVAWDTKGNAYLDCQVFMRGAGVTSNPDLSSAVYVFRSTANFGASWNFPAHPVVQFNDVAGTGIPGLGTGLEDKPYMTVDNHIGSTFQDRIYVTWTFFDLNVVSPTFGTAKIYESHSSDYGQTFSAPVLVSGTSALCPASVVGSGNCDANQFSDPFTGSDGALYVVFQNFNNAVASTPTCGSFPCDNHNQILLAKSTNGGVSFSPLVKVADWFDLPDCATYQAGQDAGRACVPEKGSAVNSVFRATNYPAGAVSPLDPSQVVVTFGSYIGPTSKESNGCVPNGLEPTFGTNLYTGVKTAGACNNKILLSISTNGGVSFTGTTTGARSLPTVDPASDQATTDQWWQWAAFNKNGKFAVSYYDRQYGTDETTGFMDISLSASASLTSFAVMRVTSTSMPLPTEFPDSLGNSVFFGDYAGVTAVDNGQPVWSDTRDTDLFLCPGTPPALCTATERNGLTANDQDIFTSTVGLPST